MDEEARPRAAVGVAVGRPLTRDVGARVLRSVEEVEAVRRPWSVMQGGSLATDIDFFLAVARAHPETVRPHVLVLERDGEPITIVPAHLQDQRLVSRVAGVDVYRPNVRAINVAYRAPLGDSDPSLLARTVAELRNAVDAGEADVALLRYLDPSSPLCQIAHARTPSLLRQHFVRPALRWILDLDETLDATLRSKSQKVRENMRRVIRRVDTELGTRVRVRVLREPGDIELMGPDVDAVASLSYQRPGRPLFGGDGLEIALAELGLARGWFRGYVLYVDDQPVAFWTGFVYGGVFGWRGATGYDPRVARYSPGTYLMMRLIENLCEEGVRGFDLGRGDLDYKRYVGSRYWPEVDVRLHAARPGGVATCLAGSAVNGVHALGRAGANRFRGADDLERWVQRRSAPQRLAGP
jgi:CelD/BcsL family acetyltransferase involved in cellulose biosynthesis